MQLLRFPLAQVMPRLGMLDEGPGCHRAVRGAVGATVADVVAGGSDLCGHATGAQGAGA